MKKNFKILCVFLLGFVLQSQEIGPDGLNYENFCQGNPDDWPGFDSVNSWFNDPDGDCISNVWIVQFGNVDGSSHLYGPNDWQSSNPSSNGWYDFNSPNWNCCDDDIFSDGGGSGGSGGDEGCSCDFSYSGGILNVDCSPCWAH